MKKPKVSFILPTRNVEQYIGPLLTSIYSQDYPGEIEVIIMDSSDEGNPTPEIVRRFPVRFVRVEPEDYNYGKTRNEGAAMTDAELLVFLSTDVEIRDKNWLTKLTCRFDVPEIAGVYGRQLPKEKSRPMEKYFITYTYPADSRVFNIRDFAQGNRLVFFSNTNSALRRSVWEKIKIPEMLKSEDQEWAKRALLAGYKIVYAAEAVVYHSHVYSIKAVFHEYFDSGAAIHVLQDNIAKRYSMVDLIADGLKFVAEEYRFMLEHNYWYWIPYALVYDFAKFSGLFLGARYRMMPLWLKKALSKKRNHWDIYTDVIEPVV